MERPSMDAGAKGVWMSCMAGKGKNIPDSQFVFINFWNSIH